jgi:hypothetical protein
MGESVTEGSIVEWQKREGDFVTEGDPIVNVTTDKVDVEVPATASGVILKILAAEGATVAVGAPLAEIDANAVAAAVKTNGAKAAPAAAPKAAPAPAAAPVVSAGEQFATPQARRLARKLHVDVTSVKGSGPSGLVLREDVATQAPSLPAMTAAPAAAQPQLPPVAAEAKVTPLKGPAAALTGYMEQSLTIPTATSFRTLAVDAMDARRKELNAAVKAAGRSEKISFTHVIAFALVRAARELPFITYHFRRDGDKPVRVEAVVLSTQHSALVNNETMREDITETIINRVIPAEMIDKNTKIYVNPTGRFVVGGPHGDAGVTGRKIIVDTYGGAAPHGGGAFSGKDPSKVDRSAAYAGRYVAKNIVAAGLADKCLVQVSYAIGVAQPTSIMVTTYGTGKISDEKITELVKRHFDLRPKGIVQMLDLLRPIYQKTAAYGHFGREEPEFKWEATDKAAALKADAGL